MTQNTWHSWSSGSHRSCHRTPWWSLCHQTQGSPVPGGRPATRPAKYPYSGTGEESVKTSQTANGDHRRESQWRVQTKIKGARGYLMNQHLLHPALLHGLLQRMAWNLHLDAMRANRLDVILVLSCHQRENLRSKWEGVMAAVKQGIVFTVQGCHCVIITSPSSSPVSSGPEMVALLIALLMVWVSNWGHAAWAFPSLSLLPFSQ